MKTKSKSKIKFKYITFIKKIPLISKRLKFNTSNTTTDLNNEISKQFFIDSAIELYNKNVKDLMTPRIDVEFIHVNINLESLLKIITKSDKIIFPVYQDTTDNIIGLLHTKALLKHTNLKQKKFQVNKLLFAPLFVPESMKVTDLLFEIKKFKNHYAIVIDEYGGISGVITLENIIFELIDDILMPDNESNETETIKISKNSYKIDARISITDLNKRLSIALPTSEFDTLGGFVYDLFGKIPVKNELIRYENFIFKINEIEGTQIKKIIITIHDKKD